MVNKPFCDTCGKSAIWSEIFGWRHTNKEFPKGIPSDKDKSGHEVTAKEWWNQ